MRRYAVATLLAVWLALTITSAQTGGMWLMDDLSQRPTSGSAWNAVKSAADASYTAPNLSNQDDKVDTTTLARAIVFKKLGTTSYRDKVVQAIQAIVNSSTYNGRALALGRNIPSYVIAADMINLATLNPTLNTSFKSKLTNYLTTFTTDGPDSLIDCHEERPNNWGTHCGAARTAIALYTNDIYQLDVVVEVHLMYLGEAPTGYTDFAFTAPADTWGPDGTVLANMWRGINALGAIRNGFSVDGVIPDDQRRSTTNGGAFTWPPPCENYVWEALQGAVVTTWLLDRAGYGMSTEGNQAIKRAVTFLYNNSCPATGDDVWTIHLVNRMYGTNFTVSGVGTAGKNAAWTPYTH